MKELTMYILALSFTMLVLGGVGRYVMAVAQDVPDVSSDLF
jgi:hypothetical protein